MEDSPLVVLDVLDLVIDVPLPSATATILDPSGRPFDADGLAVAPLPGEPDAKDLWSKVERVERGRYQVVFGGTGDDRMIAEYGGDDVRWLATSDVQVRRGHVEVTLRLEPPAPRDVRFEVVRTTGETSLDWWLNVRDPATRTKLGDASSRERACRIPPGTWVAHVQPGNTAMFRPFQRTFRVPDDGSLEEQNVVLEAEVAGRRAEGPQPRVPGGPLHPLRVTRLRGWNREHEDR
ncbi:MAG: hypothetical protein AAGA20_14540 [Planctomycetota bacterium]